VPTKTIAMQQNKPRALLIRNAASYDFGGAERFVISLADQLMANGWNTFVASNHQRILSEANAHNVQTVRIPWLKWQDYSGWRIIFTPLYIVWQLFLTIWYITLFLRLQPDVVHPQSKDDFIGATLAARLLGKRVIWTDHADLKYIYRNVRVWYKNPVGKIVRLASKAAQAITIVSKNEGELVAAALQTKLPVSYQTIYNGIVERAVEPQKRSKSDANAFVFCATSRLVTAKGIGELITAFQNLPNSEHMRLWLVGDGPDEAKFKAQANGDPHIIFYGFSANALRYVAAADAFIHPSYHEAFSLSLIEAAMLTKPIVACNVGGNPEIIINNKTGLLIPEKDVNALKKAMSTLPTDQNLCKRLAKNARTKYEQNFQFDTIVKEQFIPLYEKTN
jgi:glycosyltransferase involved in cell wall biosynthesis